MGPKYKSSASVLFLVSPRLRLRDLSEWAQCIVLDLASLYIPTEAEETFDIMDLLEDRLQHANSAVVLATVKVFLHLTMAMPDVHQQVRGNDGVFQAEIMIALGVSIATCQQCSDAGDNEGALFIVQQPCRRSLKR